MPEPTRCAPKTLSLLEVEANPLALLLRLCGTRRGGHHDHTWVPRHWHPNHDLLLTAPRPLAALRILAMAVTSRARSTHTHRKRRDELDSVLQILLRDKITTGSFFASQCALPPCAPAIHFTTIPAPFPAAIIFASRAHPVGRVLAILTPASSTSPRLLVLRPIRIDMNTAPVMSETIHIKSYIRRF